MRSRHRETLVQVPATIADRTNRPSENRQRNRGLIVRQFLIGAGLGLACIAGGVASGADPTSEIQLRSSSLEDLLAGAQDKIAEGDGKGADAMLRAALKLDPIDARAADLLKVMYDGGGGFQLPVDRVRVDAALKQLGPGAWETETDHFVIVSNASRSWTRQRGAILERAYKEVHRFGGKLGIRTNPPESKLLCVLLSDHAEYEAIAQAHDGVRASWVAGYYASDSNRIVFYDDSTGPAFVEARSHIEDLRKQVAAGVANAKEADEAQKVLSDQLDKIAAAVNAASTAKTVHEATHLVAYNCGIQSRARQAPFWFTEGLATNFETPTGQGKFGPDAPDPTREKEFDTALEKAGAIPLAQFVGMISAPEEGRTEAESMYAQAYALFRYLARSERASLGLFTTALMTEPAGESSPERFLELFEQYFGPVDALEKRWLKFEAAR